MPRPLLHLALLFAAATAVLAQTPQPAAGFKIYVLLKPSLAQPGAARDTFSQRMAALGATNLQFVTGAAAARCEAPASAMTAIAADADVAGLLPVESAKDTEPVPVPTPVPISAVPAAISAPPAITAPVMSIPSTPPFAGPVQSFPQQGIPFGSGMSAGMAMLTDFASGVIVKMLSPGSSCKIRIQGRMPAISADGGAGAFEVRASGNCAWQAVSTADWLQVKPAVNSNGSVAIAYSAAKNVSGRRQAAIMIQAVSGTGPLKGHTVQIVAQD